MKNGAVGIQKISRKAEMEYISEIVGFVREVSMGYASKYSFLDSMVLKRIELATSEAVTNVVRHAYVKGESGMVTVEICVDSSHLTVRVEDNGIGFDFENSGQSLPADEMIEDRRGVYIIKKISQDCSYRMDNGVNVLEMVFGCDVFCRSV